MGSCGKARATRLDHTGDVGCDVAHGGHSSGGEVSCPFLEEVVSKYAQQHSYSNGVYMCTCGHHLFGKWCSCIFDR